MTDHELEQQRKEKWRLNGLPVRTREDGRAFLESVGFCTVYPLRPPVLLPTFLGAWAGADDRLPVWQQAYADPRAAEANELMVRLLRERDAFDANVFEENNPLLVAGTVFPFFYALAGERNPRQPPRPTPRGDYSQLACDAYAAIERGGPISKQKLLQTLGGGLSKPALDKALAELWSRLRITRVEHNAGEGSFWDVLYRWAPEAVREGIELSVAEALSALLSKYLDGVVAAEQQDLEAFFGRIASRSRVKEAVHALLAARELSFVPVGNRTLLQVAPARIGVRSQQSY